MQHSAGMFALWSHPEVCRYAGPVADYDRNPIPMPAANAAASDLIIDFWLRAAADGWGMRWAIEDRATSAFRGIVGYNSLTTCAEIAYHLLPAFWGQGMMHEAAQRAIDDRRAAGVRQIEAFIEPANAASIALAERLGLSPQPEFSEGAQRYLMTLSADTANA